MKKIIKKGLIIGLVSLALFAGCDQEDEQKEKKEKIDPNVKISKMYNQPIMEFKDYGFEITKFHQKDIGKTVYSLNSYTGSSSSSIVDVEDNEKISKDFLELIEIVDLGDDFYVKNYIFKDKDNGNAVVVSTSTKGYSVVVQKPKKN